jgi:hypothetical protein
MGGNMLKAEGTVFLMGDAIRIKTAIDFCEYYRWHIHKHFYETFRATLPRHDAHITIINPKIHGQLDFAPVRKYHGRKVIFEYSIDIHISRVNFWMPVVCPVAQEIKDILGIVEPPTWWGEHITICNRKTELQ